MFETVGLTASAEELYRRLLAAYSLPLKKESGLYEDEDDVSLLVDSGLAVRMPEFLGTSRPEDRRLVAVLPDEGMGRLLLLEEQRITEERDRLIKLRREFATVREMFESTRGEADHADLVHVLAGRDEISAAYATVLRAAEREISLLDTAQFETPPVETQVTAVPVAKVLAGQISYRTIYDHSIYTEFPVYMQHMLAASRATGEVQRIVPRLPLKMILADESLALVSLTRTGMDGAMLVRSRRLLSLLRDVFNSLWEQATPLLGDVDPATLEHSHGQVPALLGAGLGDDAIARELGLGLRTVRRRVAGLCDELDAHSRFQAGVLAERRGLIRGS